MNTTPYANSLFEQPWWLDIVAPGKWDEVIVKENEEVVARLPYVFEHGKIVMPPLTQTLGPWIKPEYREFKPGNIQLSKQKEIIFQLLEQLPAHKGFKMCFDSANEYILPYRWRDFRYEPAFSYRFKDLSEMSLIEAQFHKGLKKNIRRSEKETIVTTETDAELLYRLLEITFKNQNRACPEKRDLIYKIVDVCEATNHGKMFTARDEQGNVQVAAYLVYDEKGAYSLISGSDPRYRTSGTKSMVYFEEIKYAAQVSSFFDFEGSNIEGIENIIRQFGGERVINYTVMKQPIWMDCMELLKPRIKRMIGYKL